ncbi:cytochrome C biogenesis protein [Clostridium niameyense]|uniref:Cytochrome C biogenesis protein n=1 Tax=Clostridium niameyense TaxID=1622073 RepID=A0A6M0R9Y1_9CLOT|nr:cytochrome C biogenesis protein [Clostridium niameyense]NEZ47012.1 cytochrome C biogenesis protein [Clostridium niameyense]
MEFDIFKIETFIPEEYLKVLRENLNSIGALTIGGNYDSCMTISKVKGSWRPLNGANPFEGSIGRLSIEEEVKAEFCCKKILLKEVLKTIKNIHPYEEPVINIIPILDYKKFI